MRPGKRRTATGGVAVALATVALAGLGASPTVGAPVPAGFTDTVVLSGLTNPTVVRFASDGRVFVAEKSGLIKVFDSLADTDAHRLRRPAHAGAQLLGPRPARAWRSTRASRPARTSTCSTRYDAAIGGTRAAVRHRRRDAARRRPGATDRRLRGQRAAVAADGLGQRRDRHRAGAGRRTGASSSRATRSATLAFGADGALYVSGGDGASFNFADYGPGRQPAEPVRRPAGGVGGTRSRRRPPRAARSAARTCAPPATRRRSTASIIRVDPDDRRRPAGQPARRQLRRQRAPDHRLRAAQPVPLHDPARHQRALDRRRRLERRGRRSTASPIADDAASTNFGWPCYEGDGPHSRRTTRQPQHLRERCTPAAERRRPPATTRTTTRAKVVPGDDVPDRRLVDLRPGVLPRRHLPGGVRRARCSSPTTRATASGSMLTGAERRCPTRRRAQTFVAGAAGPGRPRDRPRRRPLLRRLRRRHDPPHQLPGGQPAADGASRRRPRRPGPSPLTVDFDGTGSSDPDAGDDADLRLGPRRRRRVRRLDRGHADAAPTPAPGTLHRRGCGSPTRRGASSTRRRSTITRRQHRADADDRHADRRHRPGRSATSIAFSGLGHRRRRTARSPAARLSWSLVMQHCPSNCHTHPVQDFPGVASGSFVAPDHEYPSYLELRLTATDSRRADRHDERAARPADGRADVRRPAPPGLAAHGRQHGSRRRRSRAR